jgi:hypothetical protein
MKCGLCWDASHPSCVAQRQPTAHVHEMPGPPSSQHGLENIEMLTREKQSSARLGHCKNAIEHDVTAINDWLHQ